MSDTTLLAEAILFDMDGTLVDSTKIVERTWKRFAERHRIDVDLILAVSHGRPTRDTVAAFAVKGMDVAAETELIQSEEVNDVEGIAEVPGAADLLASLEPDRWAVVTSAGTELALRRMGSVGLPLPRVLVSADDVTVGKPDPEGYRKAAEQLGVDPASAIVFEDAEAGLAAAKAGGATPVVVGDYVGPVTEGLLRVPDLRSVRVRITDGTMKVHLSTR